MAKYTHYDQWPGSLYSNAPPVMFPLSGGGRKKNNRNAPRMRKSPEGKWQGTSVPLDGATLAVMQGYVRVRSEHH